LFLYIKESIKNNIHTIIKNKNKKTQKKEEKSYLDFIVIEAVKRNKKN
jgi:hypothetical protein